jgi:uncharacterized protein YpiB (UPF0302 family)
MRANVRNKIIAALAVFGGLLGLLLKLAWASLKKEKEKVRELKKEIKVNKQVFKFQKKKSNVEAKFKAEREKFYSDELLDALDEKDKKDEDGYTSVRI